jgi:hypothetical protein
MYELMILQTVAVSLIPLWSSVVALITAGSCECFTEKFTDLPLHWGACEGWTPPDPWYALQSRQGNIDKLGYYCTAQVINQAADKTPKP